MNSKAFFLGMLLWLICMPAKAYHPDSGHSVLTKLALKGYQWCYNDDWYQQADRADQLLAGNLAMDKGLSALPIGDQLLPEAITLFPLLVRVTNWHFFHPDKTGFSRHGNVEMSHMRLWRRAHLGLETDKPLLFVGAFLHLIEDISVPAHVVPVYHGPATSLKALGEFDHLVDYMKAAGQTEGVWLADKISDQIDSIKPDDNALSAQLNSLCPAQELNPEQTREQLSRLTLALVDRPIPGCGNTPWRRFWPAPTTLQRPSNSQRYFARYNVGADFPLFNQSGTVSDADGRPVCKLNADDKTYKNFLHQLHRNAIKADIALLRWYRVTHTQPKSTP